MHPSGQLGIKLLTRMHPRNFGVGSASTAMAKKDAPRREHPHLGLHQ
jgi:hypothetical protein